MVSILINSNKKIINYGVDYEISTANLITK